VAWCVGPHPGFLSLPGISAVAIIPPSPLGTSISPEVQQSSFYGYTGLLPKRYTQGVMTGESKYLHPLPVSDGAGSLGGDPPAPSPGALLSSAQPGQVVSRWRTPPAFPQGCFIVSKSLARAAVLPCRGEVGGCLQGVSPTAPKKSLLVAPPHLEASPSCGGGGCWGSLSCGAQRDPVLIALPCHQAPPGSSSRSAASSPSCCCRTRRRTRLSSSSSPSAWS